MVSVLSSTETFMEVYSPVRPSDPSRDPI